MKLRVIASSRDIMIFIFFTIFLLYLVAIAVLNIPLLASEGEFYGLNPIEAFSPDNVGITIFLYLLVLGGLFFSVGSYFFEWESGFGFNIDGNTGGYSTWAKEKDIKTDGSIQRVDPTAKTSKYAGVPLICHGNELYVDDGEYHTLVIGATGSGKTQSVVLPAIRVLAKKGESIICTDPKGELYEKTGGLLKNNGYNIILLNFRNPQNGAAWNPLDLPYKLYKNGNQDKAIELLDDLALNILYDESSANQDPFWEKTAADYFSGIALAMFEDTTEDKININSINMTATVGEDKMGGSTYIKEYFGFKDPSSAAYVNASATIMAPSDTKGGIISVFKQKVKLFASRENLSEMLSHSDFELDSIGKKPTAVFIIIQDEKKTYHSLATIFIKQVYETLIDVAQASGGKLPCRTNFLLDEFANMPPLKDVTTMITAARSRQIRFTMIIQNFAQLNKVYGKDDAETIKGNCGNIIYLISSELAALEEISKLCGEKKSKKSDKTSSTPLVTVSDLQRMKQFDEVILRMRKNPFKTSFVPDFKINWGPNTSPKVDYPQREKKPVQVFDIREFVKEKKNQKINEMMAGMASESKNSSSSSSSSSGGSTPTLLGGLGESKKEQSTLIGGTSTKTSSTNEFNNYVPPKKTTPDISVSDLVKKIDARLAEMEKEDEEKAKNEKKEEKSQTTIINNYNIDNSYKENKIETIAKKEEPKENEKVIDTIKYLDDQMKEEPLPPKEISKESAKIKEDIDRVVSQKKDVTSQIDNVDKKVEQEKKDIQIQINKVEKEFDEAKEQKEKAYNESLDDILNSLDDDFDVNDFYDFDEEEKEEKKEEQKNPEKTNYVQDVRNEINNNINNNINQKHSIDISSEDIENKVNEKLANDLLYNVEDSELDLLAPIEKNVANNNAPKQGIENKDDKFFDKFFED